MFKANDNHISTSEYIILDLEFIYDRQLYERYASRDRDDAAPMRWPMRRVAAASVMAVTVDDGILDVRAMQSWSGPDEARTVARLFAFIRERPFARLVSWGGISADVPVLRIAAHEHGLKLPRQLKSNINSRAVHLDLAQAFKGGERNHVHMTEVAVRQNIPVKMGGSAAMIPAFVQAGKYRSCEHVSEADVVSTSLILCNWLAAEGDLMSGKAAQLAVIRFVRPIRSKAPYARILGNVADRLRREIENDIREAMRRAA
ncbi:hypothetical protein H9L12_03420 [Sphingomonas rhizophila]|uniref:Predicted 3'-5' exonuclease PolB-like domain-containing protein n=1 Tax=Sphingomonas rhizophila TaxID=2071607 RepID=A0A7G9SCR1_9SPHN|nr:hypothetical protein [Sphingomonas rhizophila]QNN65636.1 hypothetical protein H9L12_03420 [Sphingomonas rhizophila]